MTIRLFPSCLALLLAACLLSAPDIAMAASSTAHRDYTEAWADKQGWVYEGMQESDDPVDQREGDAWNQQDNFGFTALDYALLGASAQELGTVQNMVQLGARPGIGKAEAYLDPALHLARLAVLKAPLEQWRKGIDRGGASKVLPNGFTPLLWTAVFHPAGPGPSGCPRPH